MTFLQPLFLWGTLGALVPLVIHLWGRRRPQRVLFPSLRLIRAGQQQQRSLSRLRELLHLLLRMILVALVAMALAAPISDSRFLAALAPSEATAVIVLDASASMGYREKGQSSFERGRAAAQQVADHLPAGTAVRAFLAGPELTPLAAADLQTAQIGASRTRLLGLLNATEEPSVWSPQSRVFLITDLQVSSFQVSLAESLPNPPVVVDVGTGPWGNRSLDRAWVTSPCPITGRPCEVTADVRSSGRPTGTTELSVRVDGAPVPGRILQAAGRQSAHVRVTPKQRGDAVISFALPDDPLHADNHLDLVEPLRDRLKVRIAAGGFDPRYLSAALDPGGDMETGIAVETVSWRDAARGNPDLIVVAGAPAASGAWDAILRHVRGGGGLLLFAGPSLTLPKAVATELLGHPAQLGAIVAAPPDAPLTLSEVRTARPPLDAFASPRAGDLMEFRFTRRRDVADTDDLPVIARFSDGAPAILGTSRPDGHVVLVNTSSDTSWTNAPLCAAFVPLMHRLCQYAVGPLPRVWDNWLVGEPMCVPVPTGVAGPVEVTDPAGRRTVIQPNRQHWAFTPPAPGLYQVAWRKSGEVVRERFAANVPPDESDPARISPPELRRRLRDNAAKVLRPEELPGFLANTSLVPARLSVPLLLLAVLMFIAELLLSTQRRITLTD